MSAVNGLGSIVLGTGFSPRSRNVVSGSAGTIASARISTSRRARVWIALRSVLILVSLRAQLTKSR